MLNKRCGCTRRGLPTGRGGSTEGSSPSGRDKRVVVHGHARALLLKGRAWSGMGIQRRRHHGWPQLKPPFLSWSSPSWRRPVDRQGVEPIGTHSRVLFRIIVCLVA